MRRGFNHSVNFLFVFSSETKPLVLIVVRKIERRTSEVRLQSSKGKE